MWWMAATGAVCWIVVVASRGGQAVVEASLGLAGPLGAAGASWMVAERTYKRNPAKLTSLMIGAFFAKLLFFAAYVTFVLTVLSRSPVVFVVSFTMCFIALHLVEAACLRQLFRNGAGGPL